MIESQRKVNMDTSGNCYREILLYLVWCKNQSYLELPISYLQYCGLQFNCNKLTDAIL